MIRTLSVSLVLAFPSIAGADQTVGVFVNEPEAMGGDLAEPLDTVDTDDLLQLIAQFCPCG
ncbi:MAG: hypothetical protein QGG74_06605 [Phycisphaerales bacterium]|jgi:hypothetical protein|nr:hypothetical protein [Phycisphaerales bacterium]